MWSIWKHQWQQCPEKFWNALFSHLHGNKSFSLKLWFMGPYPGSLNYSENIQLPTFQGKGYNQKCFWNFCITLGDIQKTNMCLHWNCSVNHWVMCLSSLATICKQLKHRLIYCFVSWILTVWWNNQGRLAKYYEIWLCINQFYKSKRKKRNINAKTIQSFLKEYLNSASGQVGLYKKNRTIKKVLVFM